VLNWWKESGLQLKYSANAIHNASRCNHISVLVWWKKSGLQLKYSRSAVNRIDNHPNVLKWWKIFDSKLFE
jgi:hypothetical protein